MKPWIVVLMLVAVAFFALAPATLEASTKCQNGKCALEVPAVAHVLAAEKAIAGTARRSAACVGKAVVTIAVKPLALIVKKKPLRTALKGVAKIRPLRTVAKGVRLICHRVACRR